MSVGLGRHGNGVLRMVRLGVYELWCPGCGAPHRFNISSTDHPQGKFTGWDGDHIAPTLDRALHNPGCVSTVRAGRISFDEAAIHHLAGQTVLLPDFPAPPP